MKLLTMNNLEKLLANSIHRLSKMLIYKTEDDSYILFDQYKIVINDSGIILYRFRDERYFHFHQLRNATAWAILDKHNKLWEASRLLELDSKLESAKFEELVHSRKSARSDSDAKIIRLNKLQFDKTRQRQIIDELNKYIIMANLCQQRGFENEIRRYETN